MGTLGPTVTLTFAGDATSVDKAVAKVGSSTEKLATEVGGSTKKIGEAGEGMKGKLTEAADGTEQKMIGLHDTIDGLGGTMQGFKDGSVSEVAQGLADMAGGIASFVIPALGGLGGGFGKAATAVKGFSISLLTSPITWIILGIIALIAIIVLMITHWNTVKAVIGDVGRFIKQIWGDIWGFLSGIFAKIGNAVSSVWDGLGNGLKAALNAVIGVLNHGIDAINALIHGINWLPGVNIHDIPHIPRLHTGGIVPGSAGREMLAVLQAGEQVIPAGGGRGGGGGMTLQVSASADSAVATMFQSLVRQNKIQLVDSNGQRVKVG
jgi:uncharacterized protein YoxC